MPGPKTKDNPAPHTLEDVLTQAWDELVHAAASARHGFHLPTLCTADLSPSQPPHARIVVLRHADRDSRTLLAHTDTRAPKAAQVQQHRAATWLFYDHPRRIQLRATGPTALLTDGPLVDERWAAAELSAKRCYLAPQPPGTPADAPSPNLPEHVRHRVPTSEAEVLPGRAHFAVLETTLTHLDILHLHHAGHQRAAFTFCPQGQLTQQTWLEV